MEITLTQICLPKWSNKPVIPVWSGPYFGLIQVFDVIHHGHGPDFWFLLICGSGAGRDGPQEFILDYFDRHPAHRT